MWVRITTNCMHATTFHKIIKNKKNYVFGECCIEEAPVKLQQEVEEVVKQKSQIVTQGANQEHDSPTRHIDVRSVCPIPTYSYLFNDSRAA